MSDGVIMFPITKQAAEYATSREGYEAKIVDKPVENVRMALNGPGTPISTVPSYSKSRNLYAIDTEEHGRLYFQPKYVNALIHGASGNCHYI